MKSLFKKSILFFSLLFVVTANAADFNIDKSHSHVTFKVKHMMISNVSGEFKDYNGEISYDTTSKKFTKFMGSVAANSIDTGIKKRDDHLRSADFFEVDKFPKIKFIMSDYQKISDDEGKMNGTITIKDVSKKITFDVEIGGMINDPWGNTRLGFSMESSLNRKDFGLNWNRLLESGGLVVGDKIKLKIDLELIKK
jgi:polyisoprenoid-binding protein YceI